MSRLPSHKMLAGMSVGNRSGVLAAFARDLREQVAVANNSRHRGEARRKLNRVYAAADHFGDNVGQPK